MVAWINTKCSNYYESFLLNKKVGKLIYCFGYIYIYICQVAYLQSQLMQVKAQLAQSLMGSNSCYNPQWMNMASSSNGEMTSSPFAANYPNYINVKSNSSPQSSSLESVDHYSDCHGVMNMQDIQSLDQFLYQPYSSN